MVINYGLWLSFAVMLFGRQLVLVWLLYLHQLVTISQSTPTVNSLLTWLTCTVIQVLVSCHCHLAGVPGAREYSFLYSN